MFPAHLHYQGETAETGLKRKLIMDPDQPFWEGPRAKIEIPLGEAVVFSLLCLLADAKLTLGGKGVRIEDLDSLTIRFSHPNWINPESIRALQCYRDAAALALSALGEIRGSEPPEDRFQVPIEQLRRVVSQHSNVFRQLPCLPPAYDFEPYRTCLRGELARGRWQWEFVFESCAAGFPYIYLSEGEIYKSAPGQGTAAPWIRKVLVVDIGAGSTDSGYLLRTFRQVRFPPSRGEPMLIWLPPAAAMERAGNWLTERIREDWQQQGRRATLLEAEEYKLSGGTDWYSKPFVQEWCDSISRHVGEYTRRIPDDIRLPTPPPLELVLTGGSSAVVPVRDRVLHEVREDLRAQGIESQLAYQTRLVQEQSAILPTGYSDVQQAQLAVCLGASHPHLASLTHYARGLRRGELEAGTLN